MSKWMKEVGPDQDIVISSRVRMARNLENLPFPVALTKTQSKELVKRVSHPIMSTYQKDSEKFQVMSMEELTEAKRKSLVEKHMISPNLALNFDKGAVLYNKDESISIMINEEDHIRIQCLLPGFQLDEAYIRSDAMDDVLEEELEYAFDENLGYLTSCPTNVGTGIRASVMVHLPALTMTGYIKRILQATSQIGLTVRGLYGEGTEADGNIFQMSNQLTLGRSEQEIITNLKDVTKQIIQKERDARATLLSNNGIEIQDRIYRSLGILKNARILNQKECMKHLSDVRLGRDLGILKDISIEHMNDIMVMTQSGFLEEMENKPLSSKEKAIRRANFVREKL